MWNDYGVRPREKMMKGGKAKGKKGFPDLTGDGKVTKADILKGRGIELKEGPEDMYWSEYVKSLVNDIRINGIQDYAKFSEDDFIADYEEYIGNKMVGEDYDPDQAQLDDEDEIPMSYDDEGKPLGLGEDLDLGHEDDETLGITDWSDKYVDWFNCNTEQLNPPPDG